MNDVISQERTGRVAAIYARVSSERQRQDETIQSQTVGLRELAAERGLLLPDDLIFEDEGFSGATLQRPALERFRDRAAEGAFEVLLCHAPDRLARRYAYQVLLLEELTRVGVEVCFAKEPERGASPEDELLRQFQGMIAEYERAQIRERTRRGKLHRARTGSQAVLSCAPYGYRYVKKSEHSEGFWEIDPGGRPTTRMPTRRGRLRSSTNGSAGDCGRFAGSNGNASARSGAGSSRWASPRATRTSGRARERATGASRALQSSTGRCRPPTGPIRAWKGSSNPTAASGMPSEPPGADPHAGWCGGRRGKPGAYPMQDSEMSAGRLCRDACIAWVSSSRAPTGTPLARFPKN